MWDTLILNPMLNALLVLYSVLLHNFTLTILVFTVLIRLVTAGERTWLDLRGLAFLQTSA